MMSKSYLSITRKLVNVAPPTSEDEASSLREELKKGEAPDWIVDSVKYYVRIVQLALKISNFLFSFNGS